MPFHMVKGMAAFCLANGDNRFTITLLVGFNCLLRGDELKDLVLKEFTILHPELCTVRLENSKGAQRTGQLEVLMLRDPLLIACVGFLKAKHSEDYKLFKGSNREFCRTHKAAATHWAWSTLA